MAHFKKRRAVVVTQFANGKLFGSCSLISWPNGYLVGCLFGYCISLKRSVGTNTTSHLIGTCHLKLDLKMRLYQPPQPLIHLTPPRPHPNASHFNGTKIIFECAESIDWPECTIAPFEQLCNGTFVREP